MESDIFKVARVEDFLSYHLLLYNVGLCFYCSLKFSFAKLNHSATFLNPQMVTVLKNGIVKARLIISSLNSSFRRLCKMTSMIR